MIDALINVATFALLVLCITGLRVDRRLGWRRKRKAQAAA
jgi:hypothetical protein